MCDSRRSNRVVVILALLVGVLIVAMLPELRRYIRISQM
jgi:hypothetical protein